MASGPVGTLAAGACFLLAALAHALRWRIGAWLGAAGAAILAGALAARGLRAGHWQLTSEYEFALAFALATALAALALGVDRGQPESTRGAHAVQAVTMALATSELKNVALVTDGRFSGATSGPCVGHVSPETYVGGPIAALRDGDEITIDIPDRKINVRLSDEEIKNRLVGFEPVKRPVPPGFMRRYVKYVSSAAEGAVLQ